MMELCRYNPHDFDDWPAIEPLPRLERQSDDTDFEPANLDIILAGCAWLRDTIISAASLTEPHWYRAISIIARCKDGVALTHQFSRPYPGYSSAETDAKIDHALQDAGPATCDYVRLKLNSPHCEGCPNLGKVKSPITIGQWRGTVTFGNGASVPATGPVEPATGIGFPCTDYGNAERLIAKHGQDLRFNKQLGWLCWNRKRWKRDEDGEVERRAKATVRTIYREVANAQGETTRKELRKHAVISESSGSLHAMIGLAKTEPGVYVEVGELDASPWLLNCKNGTLDLRTGELQAHDRASLCTKRIPIAYDPEARCPQWTKFLARITGGNRQLARFLRRAVGYSLTGDVSEQVLFFCYGSGANGKSTLLALLQELAGDYGGTAPPGLLLEHKSDRHPTEIADLLGKRLMVSVEVGEGKRMAEELVKQLTGGDRLKGRYMRQDFFQFDPLFKFWLSANHKPVIRGTDHAIWRRLPVIPFTVTFTDDAADPRFRKDKRLPAKLRQELPGILRWAVAGCLEWQRVGLKPPASVIAATEEYRTEMDPLTEFLEDCCLVNPQVWVTNSDLWTAYEEWCRDNGEKFPLGRKPFTQELVRRGYVRDRQKTARLWKGIALRPVKSDEKAGSSDTPNGQNRACEADVTRGDTSTGSPARVHTYTQDNASTCHHVSPVTKTGADDDAELGRKEYFE